VLATKSIAFICHPYHRGGVTRWMADAAIAYSQMGYSVYFAVPTPTKEFFSAQGRETMVQLLSKAASQVKLITCQVGTFFEFGSADYRRFIYQCLLAQVPTGTPVVLSDDEAVWAAACGLHASYPIVAVLHADDKKYYQLIARYQKTTDVIVSVSARVDSTIRKQGTYSDVGQLFVIPCGIQLPKLSRHETRGGPIGLLYVGRIEHGQKRTMDLIKVAEELQRRNVHFSLTVVGDGVAVRAEMEAEVARLGLGKAVTFAGWLGQQDVLKLMAASDIVMLTSNYEGMPISMMEALSMGCGFVGTKVSGIEDYEHHQLAPDCFRVFDVGAIKAAADQVEALSKIEPTLRANAARAIAEEQFSMAGCLTRYNNAISSITRTQFSVPNVAIGLVERIKSHAVALLRGLKMQKKTR
jgi:glycosyltransferase involved in cell wall biosynthesis